MPRSRTTRARKRGGGALAPLKVALYLAVGAGGLYLGVQAYAMYGDALPGNRTPQRRTPKADTDAPAPRPAPGPAAPAATPEKTRGEPSVMPDPDPRVAVTPSPASGESLPPVEVDRATTGRPEVALTFDAGADWRPARQILDSLLASGARATFFLTGEWVQAHPKTAQRIGAEGHEVGNHSWSHPNFTKLKDDEVRDQLQRTDEAILRVTGRSSRPYFRPPLGARDSRVRRLVGEEGYLTVYWTLDSRDAVTKDITASQIRDRVLAEVQPGSIVLLHCGSQPTADALPEILSGLKERGLSVVPVSRLLAR